ncbi:hypothetical protein NC652_026708 [Populus alba x Populus x berolinensis]|nr:hypothetical protein NC652_026708 [Populus alba x Populus x berolinensis]
MPKRLRRCVRLASTRLPGKLVIGDILGPFKKIYSSSSGRKLVGVLKYHDCLVERIIKEHEEKAKEGFERGDRKDLTGILLEIFKDPAAEIRLSKNDIKSFLLVKLINNPEVSKKLRDEISAVVGPNRLVKESHVPNLPYLRAIIKETLRLHPPAPHP